LKAMLKAKVGCIAGATTCQAVDTPAAGPTGMAYRRHGGGNALPGQGPRVEGLASVVPTSPAG